MTVNRLQVLSQILTLTLILSISKQACTLCSIRAVQAPATLMHCHDGSWPTCDCAPDACAGAVKALVRQSRAARTSSTSLRSSRTTSHSIGKPMAPTADCACGTGQTHRQ